MSNLVLYTDGATRPTNPGPSGYGAAVFRGDDLVSISSGYLGDSVTNNQAEYAAFVVGLVLVEDQLTPDDLQITVRTDSMLVVQQVLGNWKLSAGKLYPLYQRAVELVASLKDDRGIEVVIEHVKGHAGILGNETVDQLAGQAVAKQDPTAEWVLALIKSSVPADSSSDIVEIVKTPPLGPKGHEKLRDLVSTGLRKLGHPVINMHSSELVRFRDPLKRTNEITGSTLANIPELATIINGRAYMLALATGYRVDHDKPGVLTVNKEALEACQALAKGGLSVLVIHKPHGTGKWRRYADLGWSDSTDEIPIMCFEMDKLVVLEEYTIGAWPTFVSLDRERAEVFSQYVMSIE